VLLVTEGSPRTDSSHHWSLIKSHPLIPALVICPVPLGYVTQDCVSNSNCHAFIMPAPYSLVSPGGLYTLAVQNDVSVIWEWMIVNFYQVWYGWVKAYRRHVDWQSVGQFINFAYIDAAIAMSGACKTVWCWIWSLCIGLFGYILPRDGLECVICHLVQQFYWQKNGPIQSHLADGKWWYRLRLISLFITRASSFKCRIRISS